MLRSGDHYLVNGHNTRTMLAQHADLAAIIEGWVTIEAAGLSAEEDISAAAGIKVMHKCAAFASTVTLMSVVFLWASAL